MTRDIRYAIFDSPVVTVLAECDEYDGEGNFYRVKDRVYQARLLDLSLCGAKLSSESTIPTGESVRLKLSIQDLGIEFYVDGKVCWCKQEDDNSWLFGCALGTALPDGLFDRLASEGRLDRRFDPRFDKELNLSVFWDFEGVQIPATLRDYSQGGFCLFTEHPVVAGQRLHLCIGDPEYCVIVAETLWQLSVFNGHLIGASYFNPRDFEKIEKACNELVLL